MKAALQLRESDQGHAGRWEWIAQRIGILRAEYKQQGIPEATSQDVARLVHQPDPLSVPSSRVEPLQPDVNGAQTVDYFNFQYPQAGSNLCN